MSNRAKNTKSTKNKNKKKKKYRLSFLRLFIVVIAFVLLAGGAGAFGLVVVSLKDLPAFDIEKLYPPNATRIYDKNGELITRIGQENRVPVDIKQVPPIVKKAVLAAEDSRFYQHHGIDFRRIAAAAWHDITSGNLTAQGASTITQQLVKNSFLSPDKSFKRKIQEVFLAIQVERHYTKDEILEMYLNRMYFGEGAYGIQTASQTYFGKDVQDIEAPEEAALLAGLLQAPSYYSPFQNPEAALQRRNIVLNEMLENGFITPEQAAEAKNKPLKLGDKTPLAQQYPYPYFIDYVTEQLVAEFGEAKVFREGLKVYTTLDPEIQQAAEAALADKDNFPTSQRDDKGTLQPQAAIVTLDPHTGHIKAIVGGREHTQRRQWNRATRTQRQPGSAFKPIISYGPGIEYLGMGPATVIDDIPLEFPNWDPKNYDGKYRGLITMRTALTWSINMPAIQVLERVGLQRATKFAEKLGITSLVPEEEGLALALGGLNKGITPLQMAAAYGAFANLGVYVKPTAITRVENNEGNLIKDYEPIRKRAMKPTTAYLITDQLRSVVNRGTGKNARMGDRPVAGKTGTTDKRENIWFVGYTPELVTAVWMGYDDATKSLSKGSYGGTYCARIWRQVMTAALKNTPIRNFPRPPGIVTATVDSKSGLLPGPLTPPEHQVTDLFARNTVPTEMDNTHVLVEICPETGKLATPYCPVRITKVLVDVGYEVPEYVLDYEERVPTEYCDIHKEGLFPGLPPGEEDTLAPSPLNPNNGGVINPPSGDGNSQENKNEQDSSNSNNNSNSNGNKQDKIQDQ
ncbi:MAG: penicillin-binding protein 1A [Peptococcaceae bacterium]|nr:penicillin-binding protein 1A [Peptococcaceae bacterium]